MERTCLLASATGLHTHRPATPCGQRDTIQTVPSSLPMLNSGMDGTTTITVALDATGMNVKFPNVDKSKCGSLHVEPLV